MTGRLAAREIVAWTLVLVLGGVAGVAVARRGEPASTAASDDAPARLAAENARLKTALATLRNEELALRAEMDRMLGRLKLPAGGVAPAAPESPAPAGEAAVAGEVASASAEIASLSAGMAEGRGSMQPLFQRISQLQSMGPEALPALRKAFSEATEPGTRRILAGILAQKGGPEDQAILLAAAESERDPDTKQTLLSTARLLGGDGGTAARSELQTMAASPDARTRAGALRSLSSVDDADAAAVLERALGSDASEGVRLAALDALLADPERRQPALQSALHDASPRIRAIAECRSRLPELESEVQSNP